MIPSGEEINRRLAEEGTDPFPPGGPALDLLERFAGEVSRWARRTHLVGKSRIEDTILVSLLDSLHLLRFAESSGDLEQPAGRRRAVADIGSGAGFPGIVWAIARPDIDVTLFERRGKPRLFLERTIRLLGIGRAAAVEGEAVGGGRSGRFDVVISKAAGRLEDLAPIAEALLREEGAYLTIKGEGWEGELAGLRSGGLMLASVGAIPGGRGSILRLRRTASSAEAEERRHNGQ